MDNALNEKLDLSALHLGIISVGALLGAVVTLVVCILAVRIITVLLRRVLGKTTLEQRVSKYIVSTVRFVLWVVTVLIVAQQLGIPVTSLVALFSVISLAVSLAVQNVLADPAPVVYVSSYGESSIEYIVRCWTKTEDYWPAYYQLLEEIRNAFNEAGVEMCYNHLNVHIIEKKEETE